jgi:hypothetical protein
MIGWFQHCLQRAGQHLAIAISAMSQREFRMAKKQSKLNRQCTTPKTANGLLLMLCAAIAELETGMHLIST